MALPPLSASILLFSSLIFGNAAEKIIGIEATVFLIALSILYYKKDSLSPSTSRAIIIPSQILIISEILLIIFLSIIYVTLTNHYARPTVFFVLGCTYFLLLSAEIFISMPSKIYFFFKLMLGQLILIQSFGFIYPGFIAADTYRDYYIANFIMYKGGGLPYPFTNIMWYDYSPTAPLIYAIHGLVTGISLRASVLVAGFVFVALSTACIGILSTHIFRVNKISLLSMLFVSLMPYFCVWATMPIPEMLAITLALLTLSLIYSKSPQRTSPVAALLVLAIVLTHGGTALLFGGMIVIIFLVTRMRFVLYVGMVTLLSFLVYSVYVSVDGAPTGFSTIVGFIVGLLGLSEPTEVLVNSKGPITSILVFETITTTYWYIFLIGFAWVTLVLTLNSSLSRKRIAISMLILSIILTGISLLATLTGLGSHLEPARYIGLIAYPILGTFAAPAVHKLSSTTGRKLVISAIIMLFVVTTVTNAYVSPDFWQDVGDSAFASLAQRLPTSTTNSEMFSQVYVNKYDKLYLVSANFRLEFTNITFSSTAFLPSLYRETTILDGVAPPNLKVIAPFIIIYSMRAAALGFPPQNPSSNITLSQTDIVYSNPDTSVVFVSS